MAAAQLQWGGENSQMMKRIPALRGTMTGFVIIFLLLLSTAYVLALLLIMVQRKTQTALCDCVNFE